MVDPTDWAVALEHPASNTTACSRVCIFAEDITRAEKGIGTTGLGVCSCQMTSDRQVLIFRKNFLISWQSTLL